MAWNTPGKGNQEPPRGNRGGGNDVDAFIDASRIQPGTLEHLYPEVVGDSRN